MLTEPIQTPQLQQPWFFFAVLFVGGLLEVEELGFLIGDLSRPCPAGACFMGPVGFT